MDDRCQETLEQFQSFCGANFSADEYAKALPTVGELLINY